MKTTEHRRRAAQLCGIVCVVIATTTNAKTLAVNRSTIESKSEIKMFMLGFERYSFHKLAADGSAVERAAHSPHRIGYVKWDEGLFDAHLVRFSDCRPYQ